MPILAAEGMVDLVAVTADSLTAIQVPGTPYSVVGGSAANRASTAVSRDGEWLDFRTSPTGGTGTQTNKYPGVFRPLSDYTQFTPSTYLYGGVRMKVLITGTALPLLRFVDGTQPSLASNGISIFLGTDVPGGTVSGTEIYLEWAVDMVNRKFLRRVDGVRLADIAFPSTAWDTLFTSNVMAVCYGSSTALSASLSTVVGYAIKDIYVGEKVAGETTDWLGPRRVVAVDLDSVTSPWTANAGSVLDAFKTPITDAASLATPFATTDGAGTEALIKLAQATVSGKINAVSVNSIARRQPAALGGVAIGAKTGEVEESRPAKMLTTVSTYYTLGVFNRAPGNIPWTRVLLADTTFKLKPII